MKGSQTIRFSELFEDTYNTHGHSFAWSYYSKRGMQEWEFWFWLKSLGFNTDSRLSY